MDPFRFTAVCCLQFSVDRASDTVQPSHVLATVTTYGVISTHQRQILGSEPGFQFQRRQEIGIVRYYVFESAMASAVQPVPAWPASAGCLRLLLGVTYF